MMPIFHALRLSILSTIIMLFVYVSHAYATPSTIDSHPLRIDIKTILIHPTHIDATTVHTIEAIATAGPDGIEERMQSIGTCTAILHTSLTAPSGAPTLFTLTDPSLTGGVWIQGDTISPYITIDADLTPHAPTLANTSIRAHTITSAHHTVSLIQESPDHHTMALIAITPTWPRHGAYIQDMHPEDTPIQP